MPRIYIRRGSNILSIIIAVTKSPSNEKLKLFIYVLSIIIKGSNTVFRISLPCHVIL